MVTGGGRGLGLSMARSLAARGADIALFDVLPRLESVAAELAARSGRQVVGHHVDVTDDESVLAGLDLASDALGVATVLVNAAGIAMDKPALETSTAEWRRVIDVNLTGAFVVCREFARRVVDAGLTASIVNIASMSGMVVNVPQQQAAYNTSKAGVSMLTKSLAVEWIPLGIRVNAIAPGYFASDMTREVAAREPQMRDEWLRRTPAGRMGEPDELGDLVAYLAGDGSRFVVGETVVIDGGYTLL
ncbi:SDR family NAD(P)-dependent oxidoreductase [Lapillicoccus sp.]|uniref:SDR family NAD(P)-dependent oxidoreductase n=1 Tax=Lapillicoccus sp. TaxID=1909287 RepID=UPI003983AACF